MIVFVKITLTLLVSDAVYIFHYNFKYIVLCKDSKKIAL